MADFPAIPSFLNNPEEWIRRVISPLQGVMTGKLNNTGLITLDANQASTTLTDARIDSETNIILMPTTSNAALELAAGTLYISETGRVNGSVVITHNNNAQADRTFRFSLNG